MGYLLDNCLFDRLSSDIINQCQPYSCEKDADINSALRTAPLPNTKRNRFNKPIPNAKRRSQYPAILIGRLCVFDNFRHLDVGREMMDLIKTLAVNPENPSAARYLVVDAVNTPKVLDYYLNNGFDFLFSSDEEEMNCLRKTSCPTRLMYFDLIVLNLQL